MSERFAEAECGFQAIRFDGTVLKLVDQRRLPAEEHWLAFEHLDGIIQAITDLVVRGAPAIGITAAYAAVIAARASQGDRRIWERGLLRLAQARPTAVNLNWSIARMRRRADQDGGLDPASLSREAFAIHEEDIQANRAMAEAGAGLIDEGSGVITHCNTGSLATGGIGTALGVTIAGVRAGRIARVYAGETRPWLQGLRLTAWELQRAGIAARLIVDSAAPALMAQGQIDWIITGADRIAANGDVANKIGTYSLAVAARHHGLRFMVVAPWSTVDTALAGGDGIAIEKRSGDEIWRAAGLRGLSGIEAWNPVFDITPKSLIDCIVTERGIFRPPVDLADAS